MRAILLALSLLVLPVSAWAANNCLDNSNGNWSSPSTWINCGGTIPQPGDNAGIATFTVTLDTNTNIANITIWGATAKLIVDGLAPHTITCTAAASDCIDLRQGQTPLIDTSAGSITNTLTIVAANLDSSHSPIAHRWQAPFQAVSATLPFLIVKSLGSALDAVHDDSNSGADTFIVSSCDIENAPTAILGANTLTVQSCKFSNITGSPTINTNFVGTATITDNTEINVAASGYFIQSLNTGAGGYDIERNAVITDGAGTFTRPLANFNGQVNAGSTAATIAYNIGKSFTGASSQPFIACNGISASHCFVHNNVADGFYQDFCWCVYTDTSNNIGVQNSADALGQGAFIGFGNSHTSSSHDMVALDSTGGNIEMFTLGNGSNNTDVVIDHATVIGALPDSGNGVGIQFGEGGGGSGLATLNGQLSNTITSTNLNGVVSGNPDNTYVNTGTGGVGAFNNDVYNATTPYTVDGTPTNFGTGHPNATYGDLNNINPWIVSNTKRYADCDKVFGGPGTTADLFTQLANRWNNTADSRFTPANIMTCMAQPFSSQNVKVAAASSSGSYIGAMPPISLINTGPM